MTDFEVSAIIARIGQIVRESGLNQMQLARYLNITQPAVSKYLRERVPPATVLYDIARLGKTSMEWILNGDAPATAQMVNEPGAGYDIPSVDRQLQKLTPNVRTRIVQLIEALAGEIGY